MPSSTAEGWEVVWAGPPGASPGHPAPWVEPWVVWRDERVALPRRWDAEIRHPEVPWNVILTVAVEGGRLACEHVAVSQRPGGPRVTSAALRRLPVDTLAVVAARAVTQAQDPAEDDPDVLFARMRERPPGWEPEDVAQLPEAVMARLQVREPGDYSDPPIPAAALKVMHDLAQPARRPRATDRDALLRKVVDSYRKALTGSDPVDSYRALTGPDPKRAPRQVVATKLGYKPTYVAKLLVEARKKGLLGPALDGRAGEHSTQKARGKR